MQQAKTNLAAITNTQISIIDTEENQYRFSGYIGMLFPAISNPAGIQIFIPVMNEKRQAIIYHAQLSGQNAAIIPVLPTPRHFVEIMNHLIGRPYGWGNMYFYNDCASELKNLFTPFGI